MAKRDDSEGEEPEVVEDEEDAEKVKKRDLAGFDRALQYAEVALTKGPDIQLGTGAEGSGVGIIVDNQPTASESGMFVSSPDHSAISVLQPGLLS